MTEIEQKLLAARANMQALIHMSLVPDLDLQAQIDWETHSLLVVGHNFKTGRSMRCCLTKNTILDGFHKGRAQPSLDALTRCLTEPELETSNALS